MPVGHSASAPVSDFQKGSPLTHNQSPRAFVISTYPPYLYPLPSCHIPMPYPLPYSSFINLFPFASDNVSMERRNPLRHAWSLVFSHNFTTFYLRTDTPNPLQFCLFLYIPFIVFILYLFSSFRDLVSAPLALRSNLHMVRRVQICEKMCFRLTPDRVFRVFITRDNFRFSGWN